MAGKLLNPPISAPGLSLPGEDYQNLRRLVRRCRLTLTAIDGSNNALLNLLLPLALASPSVFHGLLALSVRSSKRSLRDFGHYQSTLLELGSEIAHLSSDLSHTERTKQLLASSYLLCLFTRPWCDGSWVQHVRGMLSMLRLADHNALRQSAVGAFLIGSCASLDVSAFSVGRKQLGQNLWLSWMTQSPARDSTDAFTALETITGYPESLITVIAHISEYTQNQAFNDLQLMAVPQTNAISPSSAQDGLLHNAADELEASISKWTYPSMAPGTNPLLIFALHTAWETIRLATYIYLWRGSGFYANLLKPFPEDKEARKEMYINKTLLNIETIIVMAEQQGISVANALLWPLVTVACECGLDETRDAQVMKLLQCLLNIFSLDHVQTVIKAIERVWDAKRLHATVYEPPQNVRETCVSLELVAREMNLVIPLL